MNKNRQVALSLIPLGLGVYYAISGFDSRDAYLKEKVKMRECMKEKELGMEKKSKANEWEWANVLRVQM